MDASPAAVCAAAMAWWLAEQQRHRCNELLLLMLQRAQEACPQSCFPTGRNYWVLHRSSHHWAVMVNKVWLEQYDERYRDQEYMREFRVDHGTFALLVETMRPLMTRADTVFRTAVAVELRVAAALYRLAHGASYRQIANHLGVGASTAQGICIEFCCCFGAVDGSHIPIAAPNESPADYHNRKGFYSIVLQAAVDFRGRFISIECGFPGRAHDARIWANSALGQMASNHYGYDHVFNVCGQAVRPYLLGDPAYPLSAALLKGFPGTGLNHDRLMFNNKLSAARMCVEKGFGRLKTRFRILQTPMQGSVWAHVRTIMTCCVIHNMVEDRHGDHAYDALVAIESPTERLVRDRNTSNYSIPTFSIHDYGSATWHQGNAVRNILFDYVRMA